MNHLNKSHSLHRRLLQSLGLGVLLGSLYIAPVHAGSLEQAKRIHDRLVGVPASETVLLSMRQSIEDDGNGIAAAEIAMTNDNFYRVTIKNWVAPWTNEEQTKFVPLNDYIATVIGFARDDLDFRGILFDDYIYVSKSGYQSNSNASYEDLEAGVDSGTGKPYLYQDATVLIQRAQSSVTGLPSAATAGVTTTRAAAKAFFKDGTNRAQFRFTLMNHLCRDLEQVHDITLVPDRIRQDVSRSPGGDARAFLNNCIGCHTGMDPFTQAFAYYDYSYAEDDESGESGAIQYNGEGQLDETTQSRVQKKYRINSATFPYGYVTPNDRWDNYWRTGVNAHLGWDTTLPSGGNGAKSMGKELAYSKAFAQCQVEKVFKAVCLRDPEKIEGGAVSVDDQAQLKSMTDRFDASGYRIKTVFADAADYCKGE